MTPGLRLSGVSMNLSLKVQEEEEEGKEESDRVSDSVEETEDRDPTYRKSSQIHLP